MVLCFKPGSSAVWHWTSPFNSLTPHFYICEWKLKLTSLIVVLGWDNPKDLQPQVHSKVLEYFLLCPTDPLAKLGLICLKDCQIKLLTKLPQVESLQSRYVACATSLHMLISCLQSFSCYFLWQEEPDQNSKDQPSMLRARPRVNKSLFRWFQLLF